MGDGILNKDFSRIITLLRKEKKLSQKQVASDLNVSQALLSHYENGIRECSLDFLINIANYYNVSCDYLLGRTPQRNYDITDNNDDTSAHKKIAVTQIINKRVISNTLSVLYDYLIKIGNRKLSTNVSKYLMLATYKMFRNVYSANNNNPAEFYTVSKEAYNGYTNAAMQKISTDIELLTNNNCDEFITAFNKLEISADKIADEYPQLASSVFNIIQYAESSLKNLKK